MNTNAISTTLGLVGPRTDPVAQLLEDLPQEAETTFIQMTDPQDDAHRVSRILVLSQDDALTHLPALIASNKPCQILLRRSKGPSDHMAWETGLAVLANALGSAEHAAISLVALTAEAAEVLGEHTGLPVKPLPDLPSLPQARPTVAITRDDPLITFTLDTLEGKRETRRGLLRVYNWARLRRLCRPFAADPADTDMVDLTTFARGRDTATPMPKPSSTDTPCIVAVVPNGVGLGHVTRMMAIGKELQKARDVRIVFWSYSRAAEILQAAGFEVILRQNAVHLKAHPPSWREWETLEFAHALKFLNARMISYDGGTFDPFLIEALRMPGCGRIGVIWVRRGMMRPESDALMLEAEQYCDLVLEPGDLAVEMDKGPTRLRTAEHQGFSQKIVTPPVTLRPYLPVYTQREAKKRLKLGRARHCLVSLGGAFGDWSRLNQLIEEMARKHRVQIVWAQSPLAPPLENSDTTVKTRRFYPLSRYLKAFDGVISATGYNSYHELMLGFDGPVLLAPTNNVRLDDQVARATFAGQQGWSDVTLSDGTSEQTETIDRFMKQVRAGLKVTNRPQLSQEDNILSDAIFNSLARYN